MGAELSGCTAGVHVVQEADWESRAPSPIAIQAAAGGPLRPISQLRHVPSDEHPPMSQSSGSEPPSCCCCPVRMSWL